VLESLSEFKYCCRPVGAHAVVFRFLLRIVINFAPDMDRLEVTQCLCDLLRSHPKLLPSMLSLERRTNSKAVQYKLLRSLGEFVARLEPPSRIQCYFGLLVTLSETSWLDPGYVMTALRRLVFCSSLTLSWQVGMRVLITCRQVMLYHPQAVIYQPMLRLLHHITTYQACVDLRDRALLYLKLLTHAGSASLGILMRGSSTDVDQMTQMLAPVLPKTIRLVNGPVPFLTFFKSLDERRKLGILDSQCSVFLFPAGTAELPTRHCLRGGDTSDWQRQWGDRGEDHQFPQEWFKVALPDDGDHNVSIVSTILEEYMGYVQSSPASLRLPFVLQYQEVRDRASEALDWLDFPRQLFSLELTFTSSEHFVPISPIRIPFIAEEARGGQPRGFPCMNKVLLKLQPISPVPTCFGVNIAFNDCLGHMYFGQLERFCLSFQDLFLPARLPLVLWPHLYEHLWKGSLSKSCWSVKVLDLDRAIVQELISCQLGPFIVPFRVRLEEEDFDFEQEECFEREGANEAQVAVETVCVIVFIPPGCHLLMRFTISTHSTIVRILTDRFQLLSYMDSFFLSWSRAALSLVERAVAQEIERGSGGSEL